MGASVLAASSLTGARRFRLADGDILGPTNLNRLTGSVCDLGEPKLTLAMRRTLEADPYCDIQAFPAGYTPGAADAFIGTGGTERLTVLVEEMDDLALKVGIRVEARAARVPVVMVTDNGDNAILDVERFDQDPGYPLFHGLAGDLAANSADLGDPIQRVNIASAIVGSQITPRTRFSLTQVGRTLPSWPQLGTAATAGGALGALAARYIACGVPLKSGRYRADLDEILIGARARASSRWNELDEAGFLGRPEGRVRGMIDRAMLTAWLAVAGLAPSPHNNQPWLARATPDGLALRLDHRQLPALGPDRVQFIALGAFIENLGYAAAADGYRLAVGGLPTVPRRSAEIPVRFHDGLKPGDDAAALLDGAKHRRTNRGWYESRLPPGASRELRAIACEPATTVTLINEMAERSVAADLAARAMRVLFSVPELRRDLAPFVFSGGDGPPKTGMPIESLNPAATAEVPGSPGSWRWRAR